MRRFVFVSHHRLAYGMKDTVDFLTNNLKPTYDINCYLDDEEEDIDEMIHNLLNSFDPQDEIVVFTDMLGGSVNQKFFPLSTKNSNIHTICGVSLPLVMAIIMLSDEQDLTSEMINKAIEESKKQILYVNELCLSQNEDDE